jgi:hypothetical protein
VSVDNPVESEAESVAESEAESPETSDPMALGFAAAAVLSAAAFGISRRKV